MAEGKITTNTIIELTLSEDEAQAVFDILGCVGGNPEYTRRGFTDNVYNALYCIGIRANISDIDADYCIRFLEKS